MARVGERVARSRFNRFLRTVVALARRAVLVLVAGWLITELVAIVPACVFPAPDGLQARGVGWHTGHELHRVDVPEIDVDRGMIVLARIPRQRVHGILYYQIMTGPRDDWQAFDPFLYTRERFLAPMSLNVRSSGLAEAVEAHVKELHQEGPMIVASGWPCVAVVGATSSSHDPGGIFIANGLLHVTAVGKHYWIPLVPVFPGYLLNVLFYAGILGAAWAAIAWRIRARRRRLGLCVRCRYSVAGLEVDACPECGCGL